MRTSILIVDGYKQIIFTPETEAERTVLKMFSIDDQIELVTKSNIYTGKDLGRAQFGMSQGGSFRLYDDQESIILLLKPKSNDAPGGQG